MSKVTEKEICSCIWAADSFGNTYKSVEKHGDESITPKNFSDPLKVKFDGQLSTKFYHFKEDGNVVEYFLSCGMMNQQGTWNLNGDVLTINNFDYKVENFQSNDEITLVPKDDQ